MDEVHRRNTQLDRIEGKLDEMIERTTRIEERQTGHAARLESHGEMLSDHAKRIHSIELKSAVSAATGKQTTQQLRGRWAAIGATSLVVLGSIGALLSNLVLKLLNIGD